MQKHDLRKLALLGLTGSLLATAALNAASNANNKGTTQAANEYDPNNSNMNYHLMTEDELLLELDDKGIKMYKALSPEGKKLALKVASAMCNGTNECKGLNACQTDKNECAGKGQCKGQGKCAISDKNLAVKLVSDKMAQKRANATEPNKR